VFLLQNMGYAIPGNWWALFLLIPAVFALASAWKSYRQNGGRFGPGMAGSLITALVLIALTLVFLLDLDVNWDVIWPAALIVIGLGLLARAYCALTARARRSLRLRPAGEASRSVRRGRATRPGSSW
jgi:phosphatidylglycerophosphate synthase